jgi:hypothetical protein
VQPDSERVRRLSLVHPRIMPDTARYRTRLEDRKVASRMDEVGVAGRAGGPARRTRSDII